MLVQSQLLLLFKVAAQIAEIIGSNSYNDTMLWGTYRPNIYFGTRTRMPASLLTGIMWFGLDESVKPWETVRHSCEMNDKLVYGWDKHDGKSYGTQTIKDQLLNINLTTEFIKKGTSMKIRITGNPIEEEDAIISMIYYLGFNSKGGKFTSKSQDKHVNTIDLESSSLFPVKYTFTSKDENHRPVEGLNTNVQQFEINPDDIWLLDEILLQNLMDNAKEKVKDLDRVDSALLFQINSEEKLENSNVIAFQHFLKAPFTLEYTLTAEDTEFHDFQTAEEKFDLKFAKSFPLKNYSPDQKKFGKHLLSSMLGGIGYFYGDSIVDNSIIGQEEDDFNDEDEDEGDDDYFKSESIKRPAPNPRKSPATSLFTGVPSRSFFPRGFLWDTGFDLLLIQQFDVDIRYLILISMDIIKSWANLIDEHGWVAREQILGPESRSKVPEEFQIQYPHYANPPTLIGALEKHLDLATIVVEDNSHLKHLEFLQMVYPKFKKNYEWFVNTQSGHTNDYNYGAKIKGFKWRGRKNSHILTSGLDDYPRSEEQHLGDLHLDLQCWMIYYAKTMKKVAKALGNDFETFERDQLEFTKGLELFWDVESKSFTDLTFTETEELMHVVHKGYITLFPLLLGILNPDDKRVSDLLDLVRNPKEMWSNFGILSLSRTDKKFGKDENYWRGSIWININYLLLQSLKRNYIGGKYDRMAQAIYTELRENLVKNVYSEYKRTGFVWEHYDPFDGHGKGCHPFTGWSSLILLIMEEKY